jgi:hypothetical protein
VKEETVFLSSVTQGMEPYREAVYHAIEGLDGYHSVRMEDFGARSTASEDFCRNSVARCTLFVGILGHQYGSVATCGVSYSEMEYDVAVETGIKRLMFLAPENFPIQAHLIEPESKRERQRLFRERVKKDLQVTFFSSADELGRLVLQAVHNCEDVLARQLDPIGRESSSAACSKTWLLFCFVTNQLGFDTGLSIANVSGDSLGTRPQVGPIVLHFYGPNAPPSQSVSPVASSTMFITMVSIVAHGFQGYIIAECNFSPARGFAMITDVGAQRVGSGYLAEVMRIEAQDR